MTTKTISRKGLTLWIALGVLVIAAAAVGGYAVSGTSAGPDGAQIALTPAGSADCATCPNAGTCEECASEAKTPVVDKSKCTGCTLCTHLAPKTFAMDKDGKAKVVSPTGDDEEVIQAAINQCRHQAIAWK